MNTEKITLSVAVTSKSKHKLGAVEAALNTLYPNAETTIQGYSSQSGVNEQPVNDEAEQGAYNRILSILSALSEAGVSPNIIQLVISIESGIFQTKKGWEDKAVVMVSDPDLETVVTQVSEGVIFPNHYVEEAQNRGFEQHTVGSVIAEMNPDVDGTDPHAFLTKDSETPVTRAALLESTLLRALSEYFGSTDQQSQ